MRRGTSGRMTVVLTTSIHLTEIQFPDLKKEVDFQKEDYRYVRFHHEVGEPQSCCWLDLEQPLGFCFLRSCSSLELGIGSVSDSQFNSAQRSS